MNPLRSILRPLRRRPGLSAAAIAVLTLAIGANTAIFSLLDTVALRPLPYRDPQRLLKVGSRVPGQRDLQEVSWPKFLALEAGLRERADLAAYYQTACGLTEESRPQELSGMRVSRGFFDVFDVAPLVGRTFDAAEQTAGGPRAVLLSAAFWKRRFAGDREVVGRILPIDGLPTAVVGVLPDTLRYPFGDVDVWLPRPDEATFLTPQALERGAGYLQVAARLRPAATAAASAAEIAAIETRYAHDLPGQMDLHYPLATVSLGDALLGSTRTTFWILLAAVGVVLWIACADVASLLLADGLLRRRELAARLALGAEPRHLIRLALSESLALAAIGAFFGVALAYGGLRLLVAAQPADLPRIGDATVSLPALLFTLLTTALAAALAGIAPAWQATSADPRAFLGEGGRGASAERRTGRAQGLLAAGQIALALALVSAAGLLLQSLARVRGAALGFEPRNLVAVQITLPAARHAGVEEQRVFFEELLTRARALPGVQDATLAEYPPAGGLPHTRVAPAGAPLPPPEKQQVVGRVIVSPGYLRAIGARLHAGRDLDPMLGPGTPLQALVNRSFEAAVFGGESAVGRRLLLRNGALSAEVAGVVDDIQQATVEEGSEPVLYLSLHQAGSQLTPPNFTHLLVRSTLPAAAVNAAVRETLRAIDPGQPMADGTPLEQSLAAATAQRRLTTSLFAGFSALALVLSLLGIYAVVAHGVAARRREFGLRMALGANRWRVLAVAVGLGARAILPGVACGVLAAYGVGRALTSQLFEIEPSDGRTIALSAAAIVAVALLACLVPARRASQVDPAVALRQP
jgi:predicted permease